MNSFLLGLVIGWCAAALLATWITLRGELRGGYRKYKEFLSAFKIWRNATESRCRLLSSRESSDSMLSPDKAFIEEVERILEGSDG